MRGHRGKQSLLSGGFLLAALICATTTSADPQPLTFLLAGQSNMVGLAFPIPARTLNPDVTVQLDDGTWAVGTDPVYHGGGYGPTLPFGDAVAAATGRKVRLIPCAYSGTRIEEWLPGYQPSSGDGTLTSTSDPAMYERCVARTQGLHIDGVMFMQGETDAYQTGWATVWAQQFTRFVTTIRGVLGNVPVVFGQIGAGLGMGHDTAACTDFCSWTEVRNQQASVSIQGVSMVRTDDLAVMVPGEVHFTAAAYRTLGERMAAAWLNPPEQTPVPLPVVAAAPVAAPVKVTAVVAEPAPEPAVTPQAVTTTVETVTPTVAAVAPVGELVISGEPKNQPPFTNLVAT